MGPTQDKKGGLEPRRVFHVLRHFTLLGDLIQRGRERPSEAPFLIMQLVDEI